MRDQPLPRWQPKAQPDQRRLTTEEHMRLLIVELLASCSTQFLGLNIYKNAPAAGFAEHNRN
jgi:hypothetical protein